METRTSPTVQCLVRFALRLLPIAVIDPGPSFNADINFISVCATWIAIFFNYFLFDAVGIVGLEFGGSRSEFFFCRMIGLRND